MGERASVQRDSTWSTVRLLSSVEKARKAGELGAELLTTAGNVQEAVEALTAVRLEKLGDHLIGAKRGLLNGVSASGAPPTVCSRKCPVQARTAP